MFKILKDFFKSRVINKDYQRPEVINFIFDNEKMIAQYDVLESRTIFYSELNSIFIIFLDLDLPVPLWTFVSDSYSIRIPNNYPTDLRKLIDILSSQLQGFNEDSHKEIFEAMGATVGLYHIWEKDNR